MKRRLRVVWCLEGGAVGELQGGCVEGSALRVVSRDGVLGAPAVKAASLVSMRRAVRGLLDAAHISVVGIQVVHVASERSGNVFGMGHSSS